ncbi:uncharacterized protein C2845_PM05G32320 [Panicum miliaceum]|uniref:Uncharacterized protein n=1 Tax=Panicum miliaceum TaxID=4540 RepID=A0A3L6STF4_PANMI|nr:uncharacterized protein C2845_PM05G32320 [Panicum miliaceum]
MGTADANKRIDLAAPLISVRRHGGDGTGPTAAAAGLPAYRADATSGAPGHAGAGAVPFGWEHRPGHPKSVRTRRAPPAPPSTIADAPSRVARKPAAVVIAASERARDEERFSDALSRDDVSCVTVNCSATGLSDAGSAGAGARAAPGARGSVMMDRFLPAAHAVAAGSPQSTFRKAGSARDPTTRSPAVPSSARTGGGGGRSAAQMRLPFQHIAAYRLPPLPPEGKNEDGDGDDAGSDAHSTAGFAPMRCGLLPGRCVEIARLLSRGARQGAGRPFLSSGGGSRRVTDPLLRRSRNGQQQPQHTGDDPGMQSWEEVYIKSLLRSGGGGGGGLMGPAAAVVSELDRTVRELYRHRGGQAVKPKASHLGLLLVLDRSNEDCGRGYHGSSARKLSKTGDVAPLLPATATSSPSAGNKLGDDAGKYGFPLLLEDAAAVAGREMALSPQPLLSLPLPKSPSESWLSLALPSVSTRPPPAASFLGLHVQSKKHAPLPWCSIDSGRGVDHDGQRQRRVHDLQK